MVQYESDMLCTKSNQNFRGIRRKVKENVVSCFPCNISYFNSENRFPLGQCGMVSRLLHDAICTLSARAESMNVQLDCIDKNKLRRHGCMQGLHDTV